MRKIIHISRVYNGGHLTSLKNFFVISARLHLLSDCISSLLKASYISRNFTHFCFLSFPFFVHADNPLICDCDLRWYSIWLANLRDKDDEMMSKKRTICTMLTEHREYSVQNIPLDRMGCAGKNAGKYSSSGTAGYKIFMDATKLLFVFIAVLV